MGKNNNAIEVKNVSKTFRIPKEKRKNLKSYFLNPFHKVDHEKLEALKNISFSIKSGSIVGIIGRNGSGKSTLLRIISGIYEPDEGEVEVSGRLTPFLELGVGFSYDLSARDNIFLNGVILGLSRKDIEKKFDEIVEFAGIEEFIDTPLKNFSSGMQVRLAFSIAIQTSADIYLLDEVLAVGDESFQRKCLAYIRSLKDNGKTILLVSHDMEDIAKFCDEVVVIDDGELVFNGDTNEGIQIYKKLCKND